MKIKAVIHEAEEGAYWAEVPAIPGCATQGETLEEVCRHICEAVAGCLAEGCLVADESPEEPSPGCRIVEIVA